MAHTHVYVVDSIKALPQPISIQCVDSWINTWLVSYEKCLINYQQYRKLCQQIAHIV